MGLIDLDYRGPHGNMKLTLRVVDEIISRGGTILVKWEGTQRYLYGNLGGDVKFYFMEPLRDRQTGPIPLRSQKIKKTAQ